MEYTPDKWMIIKINSKNDPHYRVFAVWSGGYLDGDSWKMNSGIVSVTEDDDYYYLKGSSGSVYKCYKEMGGQSTAYGWEILNNFIKQSEERDDVDIVVMNEDFDIMNTDWIIGE